MDIFHIFSHINLLKCFNGGCLTITNIINAAVKSDDQFLFTAPVMIPGKPDCDFERGETPFTVDEIRFFKKSFDDYQIIDKEHQVFKDIGSAKSIGEPVNSFILSENTTYELVNGDHETYPKGTWMLTSNVTDPTTQREIESGKLTGWSPSVNTVEIAQLIKEAMAMKSSEGQLIHDIKDPATVTVSIVKKPCQSGSKQCKLGSERMGEDNKLSKIREILGGGESETAATKSDFEALAKQLKEDNDVAMKSLADKMGTIIADSIKEALSPLGAIKADGKTEEKEEEKTTSNETEEEENTETSENEEKENEEAENEEETEEKEEKEKGATKSRSKTPPVHDGSTKSDEIVDTYTFLGRNADGTKKRQ